MNPLVKIITSIIVFINRFIDSLDKKTIESIKQGYYLLVVVIVAVGIFIGFNHGKSAAKKFGAPIAEYTDKVFDTMIKTERENVNFSSMIEGKSIREKEESALKKQAFPSNEKLEFESNHNIVEPDTEAKKISAEPPADDRERAAEVKRLDEPEPREEIKELERRQPLAGIEKKESDIMKNSTDNLTEDKKSDVREIPPSSVKKSRQIIRENKDLLPMDRNDRVLEK